MSILHTYKGEGKLHIHCIINFIQGTESKYNSWTKMCQLIMAQWYKTRLEVGIFLKEFEIKVLLEEMLIKDKTWNKCRMVRMCGQKRRAFIPTWSTNLFPASRFTNSVPVSRCVKPQLQIFSTCGGLHLTFSVWQIVKIYWGVRAVGDWEACLFLILSALLSDFCANWVTRRLGELSVESCLPYSLLQGSVVWVLRWNTGSCAHHPF